MHSQAFSTKNDKIYCNLNTLNKLSKNVVNTRPTKVFMTGGGGGHLTPSAVGKASYQGIYDRLGGSSDPLSQLVRRPTKVFMTGVI